MAAYIPPLRKMIWTAGEDKSDASNTRFRIRCDYIHEPGQHTQVTSHHLSYENSDIDGLWRAVSALKVFIGERVRLNGWI